MMILLLCMVLSIESGSIILQDALQLNAAHQL